MKKSLLASAVAVALAGIAGAASAQSTVVIYGRVDQSFAQQADAVDNKEVRPGSGNRLGFRGTEDLGDGLKAFFHFEHRFNADDGAANSTFWAGKSLVGLEGSFGRVFIGRDETPAYVLGQTVGDPWGTDTVAGNGTIVNGRIGTQRYANSVNYLVSLSGLTFGAQFAEAEGNPPASAGAVAVDRPYSMGLGYKLGGLQLGLGYENPADADDQWLTLFGGYKFGMFGVGAFFGTGQNAADQEHQAVLLSATARFGVGELRLSHGQLKNKDVATNGVLDKQTGIGYHHALSKRTTLYTDVVSEKRDNIPANRKKTGWDVGIKHNF